MQPAYNELDNLTVAGFFSPVLFAGPRNIGSFSNIQWLFETDFDLAKWKTLKTSVDTSIFSDNSTNLIWYRFGLL
jgi:hypothetical protein